MKTDLEKVSEFIIEHDINPQLLSKILEERLSKKEYLKQMTKGALATGALAAGTGTAIGGPAVGVPAGLYGLFAGAAVKLGTTRWKDLTLQVMTTKVTKEAIDILKSDGRAHDLFIKSLRRRAKENKVPFFMKDLAFIENLRWAMNAYKTGVIKPNSPQAKETEQIVSYIIEKYDTKEGD